jgi:hypothetical protein
VRFQNYQARFTVLDLAYQHFKDRPYDFEQFAADLWRVSEPNMDKIDVTRPWRDGGRDAVGEYGRLKARGLDNITVLRQYLHDGYPPHE